MQQTAQELLPAKSRKTPSWFAASEQVLHRLIDARNTALDANHKAPTPTAAQRLQQAPVQRCSEGFAAPSLTG
eukprot:3538336-Prymnesium_polylepis.2